MKVTAVIPAFNEFQTLSEVVLRSLPFVDRIIIVDDGSDTPLVQLLPSHDKLTVVRHRMNLGKGSALKTGVVMAMQGDEEAIVLLDGDGQHAPEEIPHLLAPLQEGRAEVVFGVRELDDRMPFVMRIGNQFFSLATKILFGIRVSDTQSGFRAFHRHVYQKIKWDSARYEVESEIIVNVGKARIPFVEVPIETIYRNKYKGTTIFDGIRIFVTMILWRLT